MERPFRQESGERIRQLIDEHWDDFEELGLLGYELQFRRLIRRERRAEVVQRLVELGRALYGSKTAEPGFEFPSTDVYRHRRAAVSDLDRVDWRETGLLRLSGYQVGAANGRPTEERRRILNFIFLEDDLRDVDDPSYAAEWGRPKSSERLKKLTHTLATFVRNARRNPRWMQEAIADWEDDLEYLKRTFYDRWGDFPWPDVEI